MRYARGGGSENGGLINILDTVDFHRSLVPFCRRLADNPAILLDSNTPDTSLTIDGQPFMDVLVIAKIRERASDLPRLQEAITAVFTGAVTGWTIFTEEFAEGGPIDLLTEEEKEEMNVNSTNDPNEGGLGYLRQQKLKNPSATIDLISARAMYRRNETEDFITTHASSRDMTLYAMREARKADGAGSQQRFRAERAKRLIAKATENKARRDKHLQEEAARRAKLLATPVITDTRKLNTLNMKQLTEQMRIHWKIFKDPVLAAIPNKSVLSWKAEMLKAVKEAVERYLERMDVARRHLDSDRSEVGDCNSDVYSEWGGITQGGAGDDLGMEEVEITGWTAVDESETGLTMDVD